MNFKVFLGIIYDDLVNKKIIIEKEQSKDLDGKIARLIRYLEKLERVSKKASEKERYITNLKKLYYDKYFYFLQKKALREYLATTKQEGYI